MRIHFNSVCWYLRVFQGCMFLKISLQPGFLIVTVSHRQMNLRHGHCEEKQPVPLDKAQLANPLTEHVNITSDLTDLSLTVRSVY